MASPFLAPIFHPEHRTSLEEIDAAVSARLGPTRIAGNSQPACFNRQIAMYLAARVDDTARLLSVTSTTAVIIQPFATGFNE